MIPATLIDSPVANIGNIARALRHVGAELTVTSDVETVAAARVLILPGVGSFVAAVRWLESMQLDTAIRDAVSAGAALLGICVGHQLLFDRSEEMGTTRGLGFLRGDVRKLDCVLPVPQIGWNRISFADEPLFAGIDSGTPFYFVNSYAVHDADGEVGRAEYDGAFTAAARSGRVAGVQFHPEKSSTAGLRVLRNFLELAA